MNDDERKEMLTAKRLAEEKSYGCPECGGHGLTSRWVQIKRRDGEMIEAHCGAICHICDAGKFLRSLRALQNDVTMNRLIVLAERPELQHDLCKYPPTWDTVAEREGYYNPRSLKEGQATAWWAKYKTRLARANKERKHAEPRIPESETEH